MKGRVLDQDGRVSIYGVCVCVCARARARVCKEKEVLIVGLLMPIQAKSGLMV